MNSQKKYETPRDCSHESGNQYPEDRFAYSDSGAEYQDAHQTNYKCWPDEHHNEAYKREHYVSNSDHGRHEIQSSRHADYRQDEPYNTDSYDSDVHYEQDYAVDFPDDAVRDNHYHNVAVVPDFLTNDDNFSGAGGQLHETDFIDFQKKPASMDTRKIVAIFAAAGLVFGVAALLITSSQPPLTKQEIVQMEGYGGLQDIPQIYYLAQLNNCTTTGNCFTETAKINAPKSPSESPGDNRINAVTTDSTPTDSITGQATNFREIPAVSISNDGLQSVSTQLVQQQWSNVRLKPTINSPIVTALSMGTAVTLRSRAGNWFEIEVLDDSGTTGYMHQSTLGDFVRQR